MRSGAKGVSLAIAMMMSVLLFPACAQKYGVLISTNKVTADNSAYHSEWWYDLVLQYKMLKDNGFTDDKIYVLYGDGTDFNTGNAAYNATTQFGRAITDMAVSKANVQSVFNTLKGKVTKRDYLYVWWMGHGGGSGPDQCDLSMSISNTGESVSDTELAGYIDGVANYRKRSIAVMTCHSGGMIGNMNAAGDRTVTQTSSACAELSFDASATCNGVPHAEFNYTQPNALRMLTPCGAAVASDSDASGLVSLSEVHQYNTATMTTSTPQAGDPDGLAATTFLKKKEP